MIGQLNVKLFDSLFLSRLIASHINQGNWRPYIYLRYIHIAIHYMAT
jgi:hypothetical protein